MTEPKAKLSCCLISLQQSGTSKFGPGSVSYQISHLLGTKWCGMVRLAATGNRGEFFLPRLMSPRRHVSICTCGALRVGQNESTDEIIRAGPLLYECTTTMPCLMLGKWRGEGWSDLIEAEVASMAD